MLKSINPFDQSPVAEVNPDNAAAIESKLAKAIYAFSSWKKKSFHERGQLLHNAAAILRKNIDAHARTISLEMGKVLQESKAEIDKCADACDYYADNAEQFLRDVNISTEAQKSLVTFQPLGPVLAIMPWNFPMWQVFRFAAPSLMAGNVGVLKHAANVTQCSIIIQNVFREAGFPEGVFQSLLIESKDVEKIIDDHRIRAVTLTGSEYAGTQVAAVAGRNLKKTVLELGGSDPFIVLDDADLELTVKIATQSRMRNAGQSCIAAKRFIVMKSIKNDFMQRFQKSIESLKQGNQLEDGIAMGPLARVDLAEQLEKQLNDSIKRGAKLICGGQRNGANFKPALLDNVTDGMPASDEELFGPIASIMTVNTIEEAIAIANNNRYGLGGSVWTRDKEKGERVAREIETGCVFVNSLMRSDQRLPFGGIKKSGYGRELSELGIKEFVNAKTIYVA